jgi:hypothetical protein
MSPIRSFGPPLAAALLLVSASACVKVYPPESGPAAASSGKPEDAKTSDPFKPWDEVLKDTKEVEGFFAVHRKRDGALFMEVPEAMLGHDFGMAMHIGQGTGVFNLHQGLPLSDTQLMRWERRDDRLLLVHRNPRFTADPGTPMALSLAGNTAHSVAAAFEIKSRNADTGNLLVEVTEFFVSDYAGIGDQVKPYFDDKPVSFDKDRSSVAAVLGFPSNVEIDAALTYKASSPPIFGGEGIPDWRSVPVGVRYSLFALPSEPMMPRLADDRVGYFLDAVSDFSRDQEETSYVRMVNRWRLEKKDHSAEISEPVRPIVYYVDRSVPEPYRKYVKEGIEAWNKAYEAAGYRNAIVAMDPPDDPAWSAEDMRYSTVRWTAAHQMGYAIGPSQTDPRTGEILNADVLLSSTFVRGWLFDWQEIAAPGAKLRDGESGAVTSLPADASLAAMVGGLEARRRALETLPARQAERLCLAEVGRAQQLGFQYAALVGLGVLEPGVPMPEEYLGLAIRDLVMHEVGHTLGLRHNFKSSSGVPHDRLQDRTFTEENGVTLSVMDYAPVNVSPDPARQGWYWNPETGSYDAWAITYGYAPMYDQPESGPFARTGTPATSPEDELAGLRKVARQAADPLHVYGTDEDNWLGPFAVDPLTSAWELGSDPILFARDRAEIVDRVMPRLESRLVAEGDGYQRLRQAMNSLTFERLNSLVPVTKYVGGLYAARDHRGDPGQRPAFTPVSAAKQKEAVDLIVREAFAPDAFAPDPALMNRLAPSRWSHWGVAGTIIPLDFPVHANVALVQGVLLSQLLSPPRLGRMIDNEVRMPGGVDAYTVAELFRDVSGPVWTELGAGADARTVNSFRRNLQRMHIDAMIGLLLSPAAPEDARSLARLELAELSGRLGAAEGASRPDRVTTAHFAESKARIDRALEAHVSVKP